MMVNWPLMALHVIMGMGISALFVVVGVHTIVDPVAGHSLFSRSVGLFNILAGCYWFWIFKIDL